MITNQQILKKKSQLSYDPQFNAFHYLEMLQAKQAITESQKKEIIKEFLDLQDRLIKQTIEKFKGMI